MASSEKMLQALARGSTFERVLRVVSVANPAAGADWSFTVPGGSVWRPLSIIGTLVTSAVVATRGPSLVIGDGTRHVARLPSASGEAASLTVEYCWCDVGSGGGSAAGFAAISTGLPDIALQAGWTLATLTNLIDVGDQWSNVAVIVEEVLSQPMGTHATWDAAREQFLYDTQLASEMSQ